MPFSLLWSGLPRRHRPKSSLDGRTIPDRDTYRADCPPSLLLFSDPPASSPSPLCLFSVFFPSRQNRAGLPPLQGSLSGVRVNGWPKSGCRAGLYALQAPETWVDVHGYGGKHDNGTSASVTPILVQFRQSRGGSPTLQASQSVVALREEPISGCRGGRYALQTSGTRVGLRDFGETGG